MPITKKALTYKRTLDAKPNAESIVKPGELVDVIEMTPLTLSDRRVYNLLIANAWDHIDKGVLHSIPKSELQGTLHKGTDRLDDSIRRLMTAIVEIRTGSGKNKGTERVQLLGHNAIPDSDDGLVRYDFHPRMLEIIRESTVFARLHKQIMFVLSSKYALALYEIVQKRGAMKRTFEDLTVDELRGFLGVPPGKLSSWINFKHRAIAPAVKEVSDLSEYLVSIEPVKSEGRRITHVRLQWEPKGAPDIAALELELGQPKFGRKVRLAGTTEIVTFGEPAAAEALPPLRPQTVQNARKILPGYDIYAVEQEWRTWARDKPAPVSVDAAFIGFCKTYKENNPI